MFRKTVNSAFDKKPAAVASPDATRSGGEQHSGEVPAPPPDSKAAVFTGTGVAFTQPSPSYAELPEALEPLGPVFDGVLAEETERASSCVVYDIAADSLQRPDTLQFESRFESGNLQQAVQIGAAEYDLYLSPDVNTRGNTQWFYFTVNNTCAGVEYKFNIVNLVKPTSLYNNGMKPCMYSSKQAAIAGKGWYRAGYDIAYFSNSPKPRTGYTLTFKVAFPFDQDTVSIAHCYPYTYSDLNKDIQRILQDPRRKNRLKRTALCYTLAGNTCDVLTITSFLSEPQTIKQRKGVFVSARVHPGETNASWMMKGLLEYLTGPSLDAKILRDNFVFKVIPMLNPDGVINGSSRCGLAGVDLNRCWLDPSCRLHPTIYYAKNLLRDFLQEREVVLSCDFHGHSRKKNAFMYGCSVRNSIRERVFPKLMEKNSECFSFTDSVFGLQKAKEATARVVVYKEFGILNSYTLESSFCGASAGRCADYHFTMQDLMNIGKAFAETILDFADPEQYKVAVAVEELNRLVPRLEEEAAAERTMEAKKRALSKKKGTLKKKVPERKKLKPH